MKVKIIGLKTSFSSYKDMIAQCTHKILPYKTTYNLFSNFVSVFKEHPEELPFYLDFLDFCMKSLWHPTIQKKYCQNKPPNKFTEDVILNPNVYIEDLLICRKEGDKDEAILRRHFIIMQFFASLCHAIIAYDDMLKKEFYGGKIAKSILDKDNSELWNLADLIRKSEIKQSKKSGTRSYNQSVDEMDDDDYTWQNIYNEDFKKLNVTRSMFMVFDILNDFIREKEKEAEPLGNYLPKSIPLEIRQVLSKKIKSAELATVFFHAAKGNFHILNDRVKNRLSNWIKHKAEFEPEISFVSLNEQFSIEKSNNENEEFEIVPDSLVKEIYTHNFNKEDKKIIAAKESCSTQEKAALKLGIDPKTFRKKLKAIQEKIIFWKISRT